MVPVVASVAQVLGKGMVESFIKYYIGVIQVRPDQ